MTHRLHTLLAGLLALLTAALLALAPASANPASGGYQLFEPVALEHQHAIQLASLENFAPSPETASECCNAPNRTLALPAPEYRAPNGYDVTINANGSATVTGPRGATYSSTGRYSADGKPIYRDTGGSYFTLDGGRVRTSAPTDYNSVPIHHVCTNKCNIGTGGNPAWTPQFQRIFDNAGLNINGEINKIAVPGHRGPHPQAYHQYVFGSLNDAVAGIPRGTPAYTQAVTNSLNRIKAEAVTPGSQVNRWLTGQ
ncbi:AHH domain-containing protein [Halovulum sp. GXIMD14793]